MPPASSPSLQRRFPRSNTNPKMPLSARVLAFLATLLALAVPAPAKWVGAWVSSQQLVEPHNLAPAPGLAGNTLRQVIHPTLGGTKARVTLSNVFGTTPLVVEGASIATAGEASAIEAGSLRPLTFGGSARVTIQPGTSMASDELAFEVRAFRRVSITLHTTADSSADKVTGHPGSRTTSFIQRGDAVSAAEFTELVTTDHWYYITTLEVWTDVPASAVVVIGDSIADGRGSTTNKNDRWPDNLARRLHAAGQTNIAVLNQGIGGNRMLKQGIGPTALQRFDRDVLAPPGVKWLIIAEGINDVGGNAGARKSGEGAAPTAEIIACYEQMIIRARAHGIKVIGSTLMPFEGFTAYHTPESEAERQAINTWIRTSGRFDAVIDFDQIARDPAHPARLSAATDGGDHLHLSAEGYRIIADGIDLALFK